MDTSSLDLVSLLRQAALAVEQGTSSKSEGSNFPISSSKRQTPSVTSSDLGRSTVPLLNKEIAALVSKVDRIKTNQENLETNLQFLASRVLKLEDVWVRFEGVPLIVKELPPAVTRGTFLEELASLREDLSSLQLSGGFKRKPAPLMATSNPVVSSGDPAEEHDFVKAILKSSTGPPPKKSSGKGKKVWLRLFSIERGDSPNRGLLGAAPKKPEATSPELGCPSTRVGFIPSKGGLPSPVLSSEDKEKAKQIAQIQRQKDAQVRRQCQPVSI